MKDLAVIVGLGATTPLGLTSMETAFMYRTGLPGMREAPILDAEDSAITFCTVSTLPIYDLAGKRALSLGMDAFCECVGPYKEALSQLKVRLVCCVDEFMTELPEGELSCAQYISNGLRNIAEKWLNQKLHIVVQATGAGGFGALLPEVIAQLENGTIQAVLLGGVHSDYHPERIRGLEAKERLFSRERLDALIPGEGAAFVLLTTPYWARRLAWPVWGTLHAVGAAFDGATPDNDDSAYEAAGMTVALRKATEELRNDGLQVGWQLHDVGFEQYRLAEWQTVILRTHELWCNPPRVDSLPHRMGHQGGAVFPLHLVLAAEAWRRGWAPHERVVSLSGSESGARTAVLLSNTGVKAE